MSRCANHSKPSEGKAMCPSAPRNPGAILLGVVGEDGNVSYEKDRIVIDQDFIDRMREDGAPETQFRFANACVEHECLQWDGTRCNVPKTSRRYLGTGEGTSSLQPCSIRPECRWFRQEGPSACRICPGVITNTSAHITLRRMFGSLPSEVVPVVIAFFGLGDPEATERGMDDAEAPAAHPVNPKEQQGFASAAKRTA